MSDTQKVIRFDWAIKNMLRAKSNFDILEGFLSALLKERVTVVQLLESESNQERERQKYNRVDIMIRAADGRHMIIEVQTESERDYLERLMFGTSKIIVDNMELGRPFGEIRKVISVSILYFNLGRGDDYLFHGSTKFTGVHTGKPLKLRKRYQISGDKHAFRIWDVEKELFPEYYLINVERFGNDVRSDLDEWIYMLKNERVPEEFSSHNIDRAREKLSLLRMGDAERRSYEKYIIAMVSERDMFDTAWEEGVMEGATPSAMFSGSPRQKSQSA